MATSTPFRSPPAPGRQASWTQRVHGKLMAGTSLPPGSTHVTRNHVGRTSPRTHSGPQWTGQSYEGDEGWVIRVMSVAAGKRLGAHNDTGVSLRGAGGL